VTDGTLRLQTSESAVRADNGRVAVTVRLIGAVAIIDVRDPEGVRAFRLMSSEPWSDGSVSAVVGPDE
jgi:hypothetical protein